jgi:hypothetical protein
MGSSPFLTTSFDGPGDAITLKPPSDELLDRIASITFGIPGGEGHTFTDIRIAAKIEKTAMGVPNKGKIKVFNLNRESRAFTEQVDKLKRSRLVVILNAGYGTQMSTIFQGDVLKVHSELDGSDIVTEFELGEGMTKYQQSKTNLSFDAGTKVSTALEQVLKSFGQKSPDVSMVGDQKFLHGVSLSGLSREHMDYLAEKAGLEWTLQDDSVKVVKAGKSTFEEAVLLTPETGLIEIPRKKDQGIEFKALLQGKLKPYRAVRIECATLTGNFRCEKVTISLDTHGKDWWCDVEALPL